MNFSECLKGVLNSCAAPETGNVVAYLRAVVHDAIRMQRNLSLDPVKEDVRDMSNVVTTHITFSEAPKKNT